MTKGNKTNLSCSMWMNLCEREKAANSLLREVELEAENHCIQKVDCCQLL